MISIDQLLESVDLDFEPRFVTQNKSGTVELWKTEPTKTDSGYWCNPPSRIIYFSRLKLAEFENKPWAECIYEVPRKTTGKTYKSCRSAARTLNINFSQIQNVCSGKCKQTCGLRFRYLTDLIAQVDKAERLQAKLRTIANMEQRLCIDDPVDILDDILQIAKDEIEQIKEQQ